jgi:ABC-2 type transport system ATP-binding protein
VAHLIELSGLTKRFGPITAVDGVSLTVDRGEVLGFLGPNGAGKTTTMRMVTGYLPPTSGKAVVSGHDVAKEPIQARRRIGYLPEGTPLYGDMTPASFLDFVARARGLGNAERRRRVADAAAKVELADVLYRPIDTLSKGYKRRVGVAQAILHDPEVLILDEPTDGLDPNQKHQVRALIRDMAKDKAIVISTHILEEVEAICTRAVIIGWGRILFDGTPAALLRRSPLYNAVSARVRAEQAPRARQALKDLPSVARVETRDGADGAATVVAYPADGRAIAQEVSRRLLDAAVAVELLEVERPRLDEAFRRLTTAA